jgi:uncharacterized repeat protein (TIGR01451 family)
MTRERVRRWRVALAGTLALAVVALLFASQTLLLAAVVVLVYVIYETVSTVPAEVDLAVSREFEPATPAPGETVEVTVTLANESGRVLPDVRLFDGLPADVTVVDGTPSAAASLLPGTEATLRYRVVAQQGEHEFDSPVVRLRSLSAARQVTTTAAVAGERTLVCATATREKSAKREATATAAGSGMEFHATRQYRRGDPMRRIDWRHVAKTGEFVTVQYREDDPTPTVVVVDARPVNRASSAPGHPSAVALCADSARRIHARLARGGVSTAVAAVGLDGVDDDQHALVRDGLAWVPDSAPAHRLSVLFDDIIDATRPEHAADAARTDGDAGGSPHTGSSLDIPPVSAGADWPDGSGGSDSEAVAHLLSRLPSGARVVLCTPLLDGWPVALGRAVVGRDSPLVVSSPDVLGETPGQRIARVHRRLRLRALDGLGQTVDWNPQQPPERRVVRSRPQPGRQP